MHPAANPASSNLSTILQRIKHVALDMDGTIYSGGTLFGCTPPFLQLLNELGIGHTFLTNNSSKSRREYIHHLSAMGIQASEHDLYTSSVATIEHLRIAFPDVRTLFVLGTQGLESEFTEAGFVTRGEPDAVVVGFDTGLVFDRLCEAAWWIKQGKPFIATHPDYVCPTDKPTVLVDCGAICAALEKASGRAPDAVLGKPHPLMLQGILRRHGISPEELAMVGDRLYTDLAMAAKAGALGVLVLTGETQEADARKHVGRTSLVVRDLAEFGETLRLTRGKP